LASNTLGRVVKLVDVLKHTPVIVNRKRSKAAKNKRTPV